MRPFSLAQRIGIRPVLESKTPELDMDLNDFYKSLKSYAQEAQRKRDADAKDTEKVGGGKMSGTRAEALKAITKRNGKPLIDFYDKLMSGSGPLKPSGLKKLRGPVREVYDALLPWLAASAAQASRQAGVGKARGMSRGDLDKARAVLSKRADLWGPSDAESIADSLKLDYYFKLPDGQTLGSEIERLVEKAKQQREDYQKDLTKALKGSYFLENKIEELKKLKKVRRKASGQEKTALNARMYQLQGQIHSYSKIPSNYQDYRKQRLVWDAVAKQELQKASVIKKQISQIAGLRDKDSRKLRKKLRQEGEELKQNAASIEKIWDTWHVKFQQARDILVKAQSIQKSVGGKSRLATGRGEGLITPDDAINQWLSAYGMEIKKTKKDPETGQKIEIPVSKREETPIVGAYFLFAHWGKILKSGVDPRTGKEASVSQLAQLFLKAALSSFMATTQNLMRSTAPGPSGKGSKVRFVAGGPGLWDVMIGGGRSGGIMTVKDGGEGTKDEPQNFSMRKPTGNRADKKLDLRLMRASSDAQYNKLLKAAGAERSKTGIDAASEAALWDILFTPESPLERFEDFFQVQGLGTAERREAGEDKGLWDKYAKIRDRIGRLQSRSRRAGELSRSAIEDVMFDVADLLDEAKRKPKVKVDLRNLKGLVDAAAEAEKTRLAAMRTRSVKDLDAQSKARQQLLRQGQLTKADEKLENDLIKAQMGLEKVQKELVAKGYAVRMPSRLGKPEIAPATRVAVSGRAVGLVKDSLKEKLGELDLTAQGKIKRSASVFDQNMFVAINTLLKMSEVKLKKQIKDLFDKLKDSAPKSLEKYIESVVLNNRIINEQETSGKTSFLKERLNSFYARL